MRYILTIGYDGSDFCGFQRQKEQKSIQEEIEKALSIKLQENIEIVASGRTDAGVHAIGQVAHFDTQKDIGDIGKFLYSINSLLPDSIVVSNCEIASEDFHARYSAKEKTYIYKIWLSKVQDPLKRKYYYICHYDLDLTKMQQACNSFLGEHDFKAFSVENPQIKSTVRTITDIHIETKENGHEIDLIVKGNGFLHNMVRSIAGTLVDVARGRFQISDIEKIFESKNHQKAGKTLAGCGLYLYSVQYK